MTSAIPLIPTRSASEGTRPIIPRLRFGLVWGCQLLCLTCNGLRADDNWPQFRGPNAAGTGEARRLPRQWNTTQNVVWKVTVPGRGWSSPIAWGDRVFVTSVVKDGAYETPRKGLYFRGERPNPGTDVHHWMTYCLDFRTGKVLWEREAHRGPPPGPIHSKNSYASETPVTDGERVYAYFGNVGIFCYDMDGKPLWSHPVKPARMRAGWGTAASPVLHGGRLYVVNDNEEHSYLLALDARTGRELWRVNRNEGSNWATPFIWQNDQRTELVTPGTRRVRSYDLDGKPLWELAGMSVIAIPTPQAAHGLLFVSSGYVLDQKRPLFAVKPGGKGDITPAADAVAGPHVAWWHKVGGPYNPSPLVYGEYLYVLYDFGLLSCYEAQTGKPVYERQRLPGGAGAFTASPWAYHGLVFCLDEDGTTFVVQAGPAFKLLGKNRLDEMSLATPALAHGSLLVRTLTSLYRIEEK